ncbi:MAG TPA: AlkA N-terminal domain-containing protein [Ornithinibacter sp.]|nr:AlkA N-terminal domain-containing protein [Ornithinibacter sp.]
MTVPLVALPALRAFLVAHAVPGLDDVEVLGDGSTRHRRLVPVGAGHAGLTVTVPTGEVGTPVVEAEGEPDAVPLALAAGRRWVGLDADPAPGVAALVGDPVLGPLVQARPHLRVPGSTDVFETAVLVVLGQHVSLAAGRVFAARLVAAHGTATGVACRDGRPDDHPGTRLGTLRAFPGPEALAALDPAGLQATVGITGARARTVVAVARAVTDGTLALRGQDALAESGSDTALTGRRAPGFAQTRASLLALPGVGPWTADLVALRALRDPDVFLPGDLVLRRSLGGVSAREAASTAEAWRPHRSLAVLHLWTHHAIDPRPNPAIDLPR